MRKSLVLLVLVILSSCAKDNFNLTTSENTFDLKWAKGIYEFHIDRLAIPELFSIEETTKGESHLNHFEILWDKANLTEDEASIIYEIPLIPKAQLLPVFYSYKNDTITADTKNIEIYNSLVIQKLRNTDSVKIFVNTIIGKAQENDNPWSYTADKTNFYGYQIFTNAHGESISNSYFYDGKDRYAMCFSRKKINEANPLPTLFLGVYESNTTKGNNPGSGVAMWCDCGALLLYGDIVCPVCNKKVYWDIITPNWCYKCDSDPCVCPGPDDGCIYCGSLDCNRECRN